METRKDRPLSHRSLFSVPLLAAAALAAGCVVTTAPAPKPTASEAVVGARPTATVGSVITGRLLAPDNLVPIIGQNNANIISQNNANLVTDGGLLYRTQQAQPERLIAGARVFLADAGGNPLPGKYDVNSDAQGRYTIANVPVGHSLQVRVEFKTAKGATVRLASLTRSSALGATADVSGDSTLATTGVLRGVSGALGEFNQARFAQAVELVKENNRGLPPVDWTSLTALADRVGQLEGRVSALETAFDALRAEVKAIEKGLEELSQEVEDLKQGQKASPTPTPTAAPTSPPAASPPPAITANPATDFSTTQGGQGWRYAAWANNTPTELAYRTEDSKWHLPGGVSLNDLTVVHLVRGNPGLLTLHPGNAHDTGVVWEAPRAGKLRLHGSAHMSGWTAANRDQNRADGGVLLVFKGQGAALRSTPVHSHTFAADSGPVPIDQTITVAAGDKVSVWANGLTNTIHDTILLDLRLTLE